MKRILIIMVIGIVVIGGIVFFFAIRTSKVEVQPVEVQQVEERKLEMEEIIWNLLDQKYHLSLMEKIDAMVIIKCESKFNQYAIGINKNGTLDLGIWQINEGIHKIGRDCMFDIHCATEYAINKVYLPNKSWNAWVCYNK